MSENAPNDQLRNRILGAVLLVVLAVLVIPLFLGEPKDQIDLRGTVNTVSSGSTTFQSKISRSPAIENAGDQAGAQNQQQKNVAQTEPAVSTATTPAVQSAQENIQSDDALTAYANKVAQQAQQANADAAQTEAVAAATQEAASTSANKPDIAQSTSAAVSTETAVSQNSATTTPESGWALQVGIYAKSSNAEGIAESLTVHGFAPKLNAFEASFGVATRVWIGPYVSKSDARTASKQLENKTGNKGYVTELPFKTN